MVGVLLRISFLLEFARLRPNGSSTDRVLPGSGLIRLWIRDTRITVRIQDWKKWELMDFREVFRRVGEFLWNIPLQILRSDNCPRNQFNNKCVFAEIITPMRGLMAIPCWPNNRKELWSGFFSPIASSSINKVWNLHIRLKFCINVFHYFVEIRSAEINCYFQVLTSW